jgi:thermitase
MALGHPALRSESHDSNGIVTSQLPPISNVVADQLLVSFRLESRSAVERRVRAVPGVKVVGGLMDLPVELVHVAPGDREPALAKLRAIPGVTSVQPNRVDSPESVPCTPTLACSVPNDPGFPDQWYLYNQPGTRQVPGAAAPIFGDDVGAPLAWAHTHGSSDVKIAIIDTGIDAGNPDLAGKVVAAANFTASNTTADDAGHGTHVAGIAAAGWANGGGIAGMAPSASLMNVKVLAVDSTGRATGSCANIADGIVWATNSGANVLNLSLGSPSPCQAMALAVDYAFSHGALVVAAAGNDGSTSRFYPAGFSNVLSVGATDNGDRLADFSNRGASWVEVAAPGVDIVSTLPTYDNATGAVGYGYLSGTSMAAPLVSGIAALIWTELPATNRNAAVEQRILATSKRVTGTGTDWRWGRVDACLAVTNDAAQCAEPPSLPPPPPTPTPLPPPAPPPPSQIAQPPPSPIPQPGPTPKKPVKQNAVTGTYKTSLGSKGRPLKLTVSGLGDALTRIDATVQLSCQRGPKKKIRVTGLSTTKYAKILSKGKISVRLKSHGSVLRPQEIQLDGRFETARRLVNGTLRVQGTAGKDGRCDTKKISYTARLGK